MTNTAYSGISNGGEWHQAQICGKILARFWISSGNHSGEIFLRATQVWRGQWAHLTFPAVKGHLNGYILTDYSDSTFSNYHIPLSDLHFIDQASLRALHSNLRHQDGSRFRNQIQGAHNFNYLVSYSSLHFISFFFHSWNLTQFTDLRSFTPSYDLFTPRLLHTSLGLTAWFYFIHVTSSLVKGFAFHRPRKCRDAQ